MAKIKNLDELEDEHELQDSALKKQIRRSFREYLHGKARDVNEFIAELRRANANRLKKRVFSSPRS